MATRPTAGEVFGYLRYYASVLSSLRLPVMHTETNFQKQRSRARLAAKRWANLHQLKSDGVPFGIYLVRLTDQVDWDSALRNNAGRVNPLGLYDLDGNRPVDEPTAAH